MSEIQIKADTDDKARRERAAELAQLNDWEKDEATGGYIDANGMARNAYGELLRNFAEQR